MSTRIGILRYPGVVGLADMYRAVELSGAVPVTIGYPDTVDAAQGSRNSEKTTSSSPKTVGASSLHEVIGTLTALIIPSGMPVEPEFSLPVSILTKEPGSATEASTPTTCVSSTAGFASTDSPRIPLLGIGYGFHLLCAAGLLPGDIVWDSPAPRICRDSTLAMDATDTAWTHLFAPGEDIVLPVVNASLRYIPPGSLAPTPKQNTYGQNVPGHNATDGHCTEEIPAYKVVARFSDLPDAAPGLETALPTPGTGTTLDKHGATDAIAAIANSAGSVLGLLAHPEYAIEAALGPDTTEGMGLGIDGQGFFTSITSARR